MTQIDLDQLLAKEYTTSGKASSAQRTDGRPARGWARRDVLVALIFLCRVVQTYQRMAMGALVIYVCEDFGCEAAWKGLLLSAHAFGYCTTQVLGGAVADKIGGKRLITLAMALSGMSLASTGVAARFGGLWAIAATQFVMGVAMGPLFPAGVQLLSGWLPPSERARASTALDLGITLGSLFVVPASSFLAVNLGRGWRSVLVLFGCSSLVFAAVWEQFAPDTWDSCSKEERIFLEKHVIRKKPADAASTGAAASSFLEGLRWLRLWAIYLSHFTFNYGVYFINSWSATYYLETFGLRPESAGLHLSAPHMFNMFICLCVSEPLERWLRNRQCSTLTIRRTFTAVGFIIPAVCLFVTPYVAFSITLTTCTLSLGMGTFALCPRGFKANYMDVTVSKGGLVSGLGNTIASVASSIGPLVVSQLQARTGSWTASFMSVTAMNFAAAALFSAWSSTTPIEEDKRQD